MPNPATARAGRPHLQRDNQQWIFDYLVKETGAVYHWWGDGDGNLPKGVRSHAMISKQLGKQAQRVEALANAEEAAGHHHTALDLYVSAAELWMRAQHPVFELNDEKRFLYAGLQRCYDKVRELNAYPIERLDVAWEATEVGGYLHLAPGLAKAPLLFYVPGSDTTAESSPDPLANLPHLRGLHVFSFDGPGQGRSNMRGIRLTGDNYERAASAALDLLVTRPEIDADRIVMYGGGMGGYWALRCAAHDPRIKAVATKSSYADKYYVLKEDSPRYAQLFAFLTQATTEAELDSAMGEMTLEGSMSRISAPTLMVVGEYDHRDPIEEVYALFDELRAPKELWVFADQLHKSKLAGGGDTVYNLMLDWLVDRLEGRPHPNDGEVLYLEPGGAGPNSPNVARKRHWYEQG
jgi:alpha-beta hydrolase superfamily lysophospholipase